MPPPAKAENMKVEDSAPTDTKVENKTDPKPGGRPPKGKGPGGKNSGPSPNAIGQKNASSAKNQTPGFAEGNAVLANYGLSVSGRKERVLSPFKADKFFHLVEQSWHQLVRVKPHLCERFSLAEFRHCSALQLYQRIEAVKFDTLGIKPAAPVRIPLPRNTRVFQPIWSVLSNIGYIDDDELRVVYIPDGILPKSEDLTDPDDIESLLSCTLYDWYTSWQDVSDAREERKATQPREGYTPITISNETPSPTKEELIRSIADQRRIVSSAERNSRDPKYRLVNGFLYKLPTVSPSSPEKSSKGKEADVSPPNTAVNNSITDEELEKVATKTWSPVAAKQKLEALYDQARRLKQERITPRFDTSYSIEAYSVSDGTITADPGAYGSRLHWDPQLWLEYEQFVEIVTPIALFSLSMPAESSGTYAWVLPVEKRDDDDSSVSARMPKASIPPVIWTLSLLLQSSTLPFDRRSTFYVETDRLQNVLGLRQRYIRAAIKDPSAVEQYGTY
jgi:hypothetical protein